MAYVKDEHSGTMRIIKILECLAESDSGFTLTELVNEIGISKSTLFPLVHTLKKNHYIAYNDLTGRYNLGIKLFELGCKYTLDRNYLDIVKNQMIHISKESGEACNFGLLVEGDVFYVLKENSHHEIGMRALVGKKLPAYSTAIGKALLSQIDSIDELKVIYSDGLKKVGKNTIMDIEKLYEEIIKAKEVGYATEYEESTNDITCIAVPIYSGNKVIAALSIATPIYRHNEEKFLSNKEILMKYKNIIEKEIQGVHIDLWD